MSREVSALAKSWQELKKELEEETKKVFLTCPDEIKRFHYGIITHSEAGKYSYNQYFGHWVHAYAVYMMYTGDILVSIGRMATDLDFDLKQVKKAFSFSATSLNGPLFLAEYGGQKLLGKYVQEMLDVFDALQTKEEFIELLDAFQAYVSRLYWWFHWYFPWGIGPALCRRLSSEDIKEMVRLSQTG